VEDQALCEFADSLFDDVTILASVSGNGLSLLLTLEAV
jgi:hypothetical protein